MRTIKVAEIARAVEELCVKANRVLRPDVLRALRQAQKREDSRVARQLLIALVENAGIARRRRLPVCQDTGMAVVYVDLGLGARVIGGDLIRSVNQGVKRGYKKGFLRRSVVEPLGERKNTGDNTPAVIHFNVGSGSRIRIRVAPRGFGSENWSQVKLFPPVAGREEIEDFVVRAVVAAGASPCPPLLVGVGIGGTLEKAVEMAKAAVLRRVDDRHPDRETARMEKELLRKINRTNIGPLGLGGRTTALAVKVMTFPTHIAGLPVAVHLGCHASRLAEKTL